MSGKKPPAKTKPPSPPGPPWQVILEEIQSQNRVAMDAVQAHHEEARRELQNFRGEVHANMSMLRTIIQGHSIDIRDLKTGVARIDTKVDQLDTKVDRLEAKVDQMDTKVEGLETKVDGLEITVREIDVKVDKLLLVEERVAAIERRRG